MSKQEPPKFDWSKVQAMLGKLPPDIRDKIEIPLRSTNPRVFLQALKSLRDQLDAGIKKLEEVLGEHPGTDTGTRGQ